MSLQKNTKTNLGVCLALAVMTFVVFGQTLTHGFVDYDDNAYVYANPQVVQGVTLKGIAWAFSTFYANNWHPLTWLSHMLDCQLYGLHPWGHHLTNVLIHTATVVALFLVLKNMTGALWRSAFAAAVFAIHPLRVESVAWVAERKDVLSGLFFVLTIGAYVHYTRRQSVARYGLVLLWFALGLMSKPMLVTLPIVLLALDYWPLQRQEPVVRLIKEKLPLLALSVVSCLMTIAAQLGGIQSAGFFSLPARLGNAVVSCVVYLGETVWPVGLAPFYPFPIHGPGIWKVALAGALVVAIFVIAWRERRRWPWLLVGWLWYLAMLLPVIGIVQVGDQAHADRYTYLPQIGICIAATWLFAQWQMDRVARGAMMAWALALLMFCAGKQTACWRDDKTLWSHAMACTSDNYVAHFNLGNALRLEGKLDEALAQFEQAVQIRPDYPQAHNNLGKALLLKGDMPQAIAHFQIALKINSDYIVALDNLGMAFSQIGDFTNAIAQFQKELQLRPSDSLLRSRLAWLLATCPDASLRDGAKAVELAQQANEQTGGQTPIFLQTLAAAYAETGRFPEAVQTAQQALDNLRNQPNAVVEEQLREELKLYQAGKPFHINLQQRNH